MSAMEYPKEYSPNVFPYAAIFERLTRELQAKPADPFTTYSKFLKLRREADLRPGADYCSTAITTGGHVHIPGLALQEVIARNTKSARLLAAELVRKDVLHPRTMILPVDMGYVPGWGQSDWISFWLAVISGVDLGTRPNSIKLNAFRARLEEQLASDEVNLTLMNNHEATAADRAPEYFKFARAWAQLTDKHHPEPNGSHRIVSLIDTKDSLGSQTERLFARLRGIPMYNVGVVGAKGGAFQNKSLYRDLEMIVAYGGTTVEFISGSTFVLSSPKNKHQTTLDTKKPVKLSGLR
jgi:hypothetical protein